MKRINNQLLIGLFCLLYTQLSFAQSSNAQLSGTVTEENGTPVGYANVILKAGQDSALVKVEYTNEEGQFSIQQLQPGNYFITVSYVGFPEMSTNPFVLEAGQELNLPTISLQAAAEELDEVTVTAERPLVEIHPDKTVFNVEGSVNATGNSALELLRKSPGVIVDNNENITLLGRSGVQVYIDGKPSPLSGTDLAAFLKTLNSSEIDAIELITNPSAKYDAEGNAGIINIKLKKDKSLGANANLNLGYSVGKVAQYNTSLSGNYRSKRLNTFATYSFNDGRNTNFMNMHREQLGAFFDQENTSGGGWESHNFKVGSDFFLNKKSTLGFMVNGYLSDGYWDGNTRTEIGTLGESQVDSLLIASSNSDNNRNNLNFNVNYAFDNGNGSTWNIDADYGLFRNEGTEMQPNRYFRPDGQTLLTERINYLDKPTDIDIYTFKIDHERQALGGKIGAGLKFSYVRTDNTFDFYNVLSGQNVLNTDRSNQFEYTENVNAAYLKYDRKLNDQLSLSLGLRAEQTNSTGDLTSEQQNNNNKVDRDYIDIFPSGGLTYTPNQDHSWSLNYSRRINRPNYQDLNPFRNQLDELTFEQGNPFLNPEYANSVQLRHTYKYRYSTTVSYSHTVDQITRITDTSGVAASFITWLNLADQHNYSINFSAPVSLTEWWSSYTSLTGSHTRNRANYGEGKVVDLKASTFNIYSQHTFKLPKEWSAEVSGWYNSPGLWGGTFEMNSMWSVDAGVQKKIMDGRGNLKLSVTDIFKTNEWGGTSQFGALFMDIEGGWDSRRLRLNFTYLIGNSQVKRARKRQTGLEDEAGRVGEG